MDYCFSTIKINDVLKFSKSKSFYSEFLITLFILYINVIVKKSAPGCDK